LLFEGTIEEARTMTELADSIVPHLVPIIFWIIFGAIALTAIFLRHQRELSRHRLIQTLAEHGQQIPPELFADPARDRPKDRVEHGIILLSVGAALAVFLWAMTSGLFGEETGPHWLPFVGVFPFLIGLAMLAIGLTQRPHE
jgi:hypothetical protein